jgi:hypothetical protein
MHWYHDRGDIEVIVPSLATFIRDCRTTFARTAAGSSDQPALHRSSAPGVEQVLLHVSWLKPASSIVRPARIREWECPTESRPFG